MKVMRGKKLKINIWKGYLKNEERKGENLVRGTTRDCDATF